MVLCMNHKNHGGFNINNVTYADDIMLIIMLIHRRAPDIVYHIVSSGTASSQIKLHDCW